MRVMMTVIRRVMMVQANWDGAVNCPLKSRVLPSVIALFLHCPSYSLHCPSYMAVALILILGHCTDSSHLALALPLILGSCTAHTTHLC